jgi:hypothetical protein
MAAERGALLLQWIEAILENENCFFGGFPELDFLFNKGFLRSEFARRARQVSL